MWLPIDLDEENMMEPVAIFPLPQMVLMPGEPMPLHIFEDRYRRMAESVLGTQRLMVMGHLRPGWEMNYEGSPEIYSIAGLGKVVMDERLEDGRFNLLLWGMKRIRIKQIVQEKPFRTARVEIVEDIFSKTAPDFLDSLESDILQLMQKVTSNSKKSGVEQDPAVPAVSDVPYGTLPLGLLCDTVASSAVTASLDKQMLLEETDVVRRAEKLIFLLKMKLQSAGQNFSGPGTTIH